MGGDVRVVEVVPFVRGCWWVVEICDVWCGWDRTDPPKKGETTKKSNRSVQSINLAIALILCVPAPVGEVADVDEVVPRCVLCVCVGGWVNINNANTSKTKQNKTKQNKTKQNKTKQNKTKCVSDVNVPNQPTNQPTNHTQDAPSADPEWMRTAKSS